MFISKEIVNSHLEKIELLNINESDSFPYNNFIDLQNSIMDDDKRKIILSTSISSEYELLVKKFMPNIL